MVVLKPLNLGEDMTKEKLGAHGKMRKYDTEDGEYLPKNINSMSTNELSEKLKIDLSKKDKADSVKIERGKDNILPKLSQEALKEMGLIKNKEVLLKSTIIERNLERHPDISIDTIGNIVEKALYDYDAIFPGKNKNEKYFSFIKVMRVSLKSGKPIYGVVLLDVNINNDNFEIVHCHWVKEKNIKSLK